MKKVLLKIDGMTCSACSNGLEKYLNKQEGIKQASVNLVMNHASIEYDETLLDIPKIERFIEKAGFESLGIDKLEKEKKKASNEKYILIGLTILAIFILYISMGQMVGLPIFKILNMHQYPINFSIVQLVLSVVAIFLGKDILKNGYKNLIHKTPNMDTLVGLGVISSLLYSMYNTYLICIGNEEAVHHLYYESIVIILFFIKTCTFIILARIDICKLLLPETECRFVQLEHLSHFTNRVVKLLRLLLFQSHTFTLSLIHNLTMIFRNLNHPVIFFRGQIHIIILRRIIVPSTHNNFIMQMRAG